jgi:hypothetical protein
MIVDLVKAFLVAYGAWTLYCGMTLRREQDEFVAKVHRFVDWVLQ